MIHSLIFDNFPNNPDFPYRFFPNHVENQSLNIWLNSIRNIEDKTDILQIQGNVYTEFRNQHTTNTDEGDRILIINEYVIGNGDYTNSAYDIEKSFLNLLKNEIICQKLTELVNDNFILNKDVEFIVNNVSDVSESIKNIHYNKRLSCCPTIYKLITQL